MRPESSCTTTTTAATILYYTNVYTREDSPSLYTTTFENAFGRFSWNNKREPLLLLLILLLFPLILCPRRRSLKTRSLIQRPLVEVPVVLRCVPNQRGFFGCYQSIGSLLDWPLLRTHRDKKVDHSHLSSFTMATTTNHIDTEEEGGYYTITTTTIKKTLFSTNR